MKNFFSSYLSRVTTIKLYDKPRREPFLLGSLSRPPGPQERSSGQAQSCTSLPTNLLIIFVINRQVHPGKVHSAEVQNVCEAFGVNGWRGRNPLVLTPGSLVERTKWEGAMCAHATKQARKIEWL